MTFLSEEQQYILLEVKSGKNVVVDACAGSGKTTLILYTAKELYRRKFLQMTYNSMLRHEVAERVKKNSVKNMTVHTFHSLAVKYYYSTAYTDRGIRYIIHNNLSPTTPIDKFNVLVIDEAQDMTFLYFMFLSKVVRDMGGRIQLLVLGDYMQGLYEFKGADTRFLTLAQSIWKDNPALKSQEFSLCTMKMSYRITNQMCYFINRAVLGENRMESCRNGPAVVYASNTSSNLERIIIAEIFKIFERGGQPSEIFIIAASVKGVNSKIRSLENSLVEKGIPCYVPVIDGDKVDERVIDKKIVFATFHTVKGRERKYVFVIGFDQSYFIYNARTAPRDKCPNTLYVATTRAKETLYLLEQNEYRSDRPLEFLHMTHNDMLNNPDFVHFRGIPRNTFFRDLDAEQREQELVHNHMITPTDLIRFISESVIEEISELMDRIFVIEKEAGIEIDIPNIIETKQGFFEEVSDLNGISIPCMYYDYLQTAFSTESTLPPNTLISIIEENIQTMKPEKHAFLKNIARDLPSKMESIQDYLYTANVSLAIQERLYSRLKQIDNDEYTWITDGMTDLCKERLRNTVGEDLQDSSQPPRIEETIIHQSNHELHEHIDTFLKQYFEPHNVFRFTARIDIMTDNFTWELKCTTKLSIDHLLQVIIYAWLWQMLPANFDAPLRTFKIMNIRTGEIQKLCATRNEIDMIMVALLKSKFLEQPTKTDDEFIEDCKMGYQPVAPSF